MRFVAILFCLIFLSSCAVHDLQPHQYKYFVDQARDKTSDLEDSRTLDEIMRRNKGYHHSEHHAFNIFPFLLRMIIIPNLKL